MLKHFLLFSLFLLLISCYHENKPTTPKPDPLLTHDEMVEVLTDIQIVEGILVERRQTKTEISDGYRDSLFQVVFDHYGITSRNLRENINFYNKTPKMMEEMYEEVLTNLSKKQSEIKIKTKEIDAARKAELEKKTKEEEAANKANDTIASDTIL